MRLRVVALTSVLLAMCNALFGVGFSGATWTGATSTALAVLAANDWTPPTVSVSPLASTVQGTVTVTATASDARSSIDPASLVVEYHAVGASTWTAYAGCARTGTNPATATCSWNTSALPDGSYEVRARATDTAGYSTTSVSVTTTLRNAIAVKLTRLPTYLRGSVAVAGAVVDNGGPTSGTLFLESTPAGGTTFAQLNNSCSAAAASTLTCAWNTTGVGDGRYDVRARAVAATTAVDTLYAVTVDNTVPAASMTVPGGVLSGSVTLSATASDVTSGVASVDLQYRTGQNAWTSCTPLTGSYTCNLDTTTLTQGATYEFRTYVTDAAGNVATATPATQGRVVDNTPATVTLASPPANAVLGGTTTVTMNAGSPRGVSSVRVEYATSASGPWTTACTAPGTGATASRSYSCTWDTTPLTGSNPYYVRAVAVETYGGATPASAAVTITVDNTDGTVTVTSPAPKSVVSGTVTLQSSTVSPTGVTSIAYQVRKVGTSAWTQVCTATAPTYSCPWSTPAEYGTAWQVQAVMTQGNQRVVTSKVPTDVTVSNIDGSVSVTGPATGSTVRGSAVSLTASASSNAGVTKVTFRRTAPNGTFTECTATGTGPYSCNWDTTGITYGTYTITATMTHGTGQTVTSAPVSVTVDNRVLAGVDVQGATGATNGLPDRNDTITLTYSGLANLATIKPGLAYNTPTALGVTLTGTAGNSGDILTFSGANLGTVAVASNFYSNNKTMTYTGSTLTATQGTNASGQPVTVLTITLGSPPATLPNGEAFTANTSAGTMVWTPSAAVTDGGGTASSTTAVTESGASDRDF